MYKLLLVFYILGVSTITAQQDSLVVHYDTTPLQEVVTISDEDIAVYTDDADFNYEEEIEESSSFLKDIWNWFVNKITQFFEWIFGVETAPTYLAIFLELIPYILLGLLLFLIVWWVLKINIRNQKKSEKNWNTVHLSEEENIIKNENIDDLISQALNAKNYRLAVRYYYLLILKLLSKKDIIAWELQKTNSDYLYEIEKKELKAPFADITRLYDYIWYGDFTIDEAKYNRVATEFDSLKNTLNKNA